MSVGGERDNTPGSEVTDGAFGPFVLPAGTRHIAISLENISVVTGGIPPRDSSPDRYLGELLIDGLLRGCSLGRALAVLTIGARTARAAPNPDGERRVAKRSFTGWARSALEPSCTGKRTTVVVARPADPWLGQPR
jgi:hypothetical protein